MHIQNLMFGGITPLKTHRRPACCSFGEAGAEVMTSGDTHCSHLAPPANHNNNNEQTYGTLGITPPQIAKRSNAHTNAHEPKGKPRLQIPDSFSFSAAAVWSATALVELVHRTELQLQTSGLSMKNLQQVVLRLGGDPHHRGLKRPYHRSLGTTTAQVIKCSNL